MTTTRTPSQQITDEVTSWPGVKAGYGARGEFSFTVGEKEVGHLHGDWAAHFALGRTLSTRLREEGRVSPYLANRPNLGARQIDGPDDVRDVIEMLQLNYDRIVARYGLP